MSENTVRDVIRTAIEERMEYWVEQPDVELGYEAMTDDFAEHIERRLNEAAPPPVLRGKPLTDEQYEAVLKALQELHDGASPQMLVLSEPATVTATDEAHRELEALRAEVRRLPLFRVLGQELGEVALKANAAVLALADYFAIAAILREPEGE